MNAIKKNLSEIIAAEIPVEQVSWDDLTPAANTLQRAFADNAMMRFMTASARNPDAALNQNFVHILRRTRVNGIIMRTSERHEGIAVWFLNGFATSSLLLNLGVAWYKLRAFRLREIRKLLPFYMQIERAHARIISQPHYYLEILGVAPRFQGQGYSSKLLRPVLAHADEKRLKCYLETQDEENVSLYQHFGYEVVDTIPVAFDPTPYSLMLRKPRTAKSYFFGK